jgi:hypothetical protein
MRYQVTVPNKLTCYGAPETAMIVRQLDAAIVSAASNLNVGARAKWTPDDGVQVIEIDDGAKFSIGDVVVSAIENANYPSGHAKGGTHAIVAFRPVRPTRAFDRVYRRYGT